MSDDWPIRTYRTQQEADALPPAARNILHEVERRLNPGDFDIAWPTLFVGRSIPELAACVGVSIPGIRRAILSLEFPLDEPFEATVQWIVNGLLRWRAKYFPEEG